MPIHLLHAGLCFMDFCCTLLSFLFLSVVSSYVPLFFLLTDVSFSSYSVFVKCREADNSGFEQIIDIYYGIMILVLFCVYFLIC